MTIQNLPSYSISNPFQRTVFHPAKNTENKIGHSAIQDTQLISIQYQYRFDIQIETKENLLQQSTLKKPIGSLQKLLQNLRHNDRPLAELTPKQAADLVNENGYYGVSQTAQRIIDFVLNGAGEDLSMLKAGREGVLKGFMEAEKIWGDKLPDISYDTMETALSAIDRRIETLGGQAIDLSA